jgi:hypothetical protein
VRYKPGTKASIGTAALLVALAGCLSGDISETSEPIAPPDSTDGPPPIQRGSLSARVRFEAADVATASAAQLSIVGLSVTLVREGSADAPRTAQTDAQGNVKFESLLQGRYTMAISRQLTAAERARLSAADQEVSLFAGSAAANLGPGQHQQHDIDLVAGRRGSLVISEVFNHNTTPVYGMGDHLEVYNNSDTTVYLDGLYLLLTGVGGYHDGNELKPCSDPVSMMLRNDASRFWTHQIWMFPGTGRQYDVPPGEGRVVAMDAIDHFTASGNNPMYSDLSGAHFEQFMSDADTDNPGSVNMLRVRITGTGIFGRGFPLNNNRTIAIALPAPIVDSATHTSQSPVPGEGLRSTTYVAIPAANVLDAFSYGTDPLHLEAFPHLPRPCNPWISPVFDRAHFVPHMTERTGTIRRRTMGTMSNGRDIVQRTRNSSRDIEIGPSLRRSLRRQ